MSTPAEIREQLTDILGKVADVPSEAVRDTAILKDVGVDSIATVELAEGIGRTFDLRLADETVNEWRTVGDLVRTVQREEAAKAHRLEPVAPPTMTDEERTGAFKQLAIFFALIGAGLGIVIGVGAAALLTSSGFDVGSLPPISTPAIPTALGTATSSSGLYAANLNATFRPIIPTAFAPISPSATSPCANPCGNTSAARTVIFATLSGDHPHQAARCSFARAFTRAFVVVIPNLHVWSSRYVIRIASSM